MKKKKSLALALSLALIAVVGIGSTFAYFTDNDTKTNVVTMGHVDIVLDETSSDEKAQKVETGIEYTDVVPGDELEKVVTLSLGKNSRDAYVRVGVKFMLGEKEMVATDTFALPELKLNGETVPVSEDGYITLSREFLANNDNEKSLTVFDSVVIPTSWTNSMAEETFTIELTAEAIQKENFDLETNEDWGTIDKYETPTTEPSPVF